MAITAFTSTAIIDATSIGKTVLTASSEGVAADAIGLGATDDVTFNSVDSVDGSFSGNLNTEVGGSQRVYSLGTQGDTDTEYLETSFNSGAFDIETKATGSGAVRTLNLRTGAFRFYAAGSLALASAVGFTLDSYYSIVPKNASRYLGTTTDRWANVASVDGDFSGRVLTTRLENLDGLSYIRVSGGTTSPIKLWRNTAPQGNNAFDMGADAERFRTVYSVDGSFSGNLNTEVGGSYKLYNLGTKGDADTEYLEMAWTGSGSSAKGIISVGSTGLGVSRELILAGNSFRIRGAGGVGDRFYVDDNSILFQIDGKVSNGVNFRPNTVTASNTSELGESAYRWRNIFGVDGDFSGDVIMAANVDFTGLPTADPVVAGRLWNDSGTLKISTG